MLCSVIMLYITLSTVLANRKSLRDGFSEWKSNEYSRLFPLQTLWRGRPTAAHISFSKCHAYLCDQTTLIIGWQTMTDLIVIGLLACAQFEVFHALITWWCNTPVTTEWHKTLQNLALMCAVSWPPMQFRETVLVTLPAMSPFGIRIRGLGEYYAVNDWKAKAQGM